MNMAATAGKSTEGSVNGVLLDNLAGTGSSAIVLRNRRCKQPANRTLVSFLVQLPIGIR